MMIRKQNYNTQLGRRKEQKSSDSNKEKGNRIEETQHGPAQSPSNIGVVQENRKKLNKRIRWSREEMKEVLWCFKYIKENTLRENYKKVYKLWRERNPVTKMNIEAKALLYQKNYILKAQRITTVEIDERKNINLKIGVETEDYINEMNGDKMDKNVIKHQKRVQENENTYFGRE